MRGEWSIDGKSCDRKVPNSINVKRNGGIVIGKKKFGVIDYYYVNSSTKIKMRHFLHAKTFSLKHDGKTSLIAEKRGYSILKKWKNNGNSTSVVTAEGDICDIIVDNFIACGGKIEV